MISLRYIISIYTILFFYSCKVQEKVSYLKPQSLNATSLERILSSGLDTIRIGAGKMFIDRTITLPSNTIIIGSKNTIIQYDQSQNYHLFRSGNTSNILIKDLTIRPINKHITKSHNQGYYAFKLLNVSGLVMDNIIFEDNLNTAVAIFDAEDARFSNCTFKNMGADTKGKSYSYDGIFIGAYNTGTNGVIIDRCRFENIGTNQGNVSFSNDGDGIQTYTKKSFIKNISISNCTFSAIGRRGIKIQSGSKIKIQDNTFENCKIALGISMASSTQDVFFRNNLVSKGTQGINTNSTKNKPCSVMNFQIVNNEFTDLYGGIRTSGTSSINNASILSNKSSKLKAYFFDGKISNSEISNNTIKDFQIDSKLKVKSSMFLWNGSENNSITSNIFQSSKEGVLDIYLYKNTKGIMVDKNESTVGKKVRKVSVRDKSSENRVKN